VNPQETPPRQRRLDELRTQLANERTWLAYVRTVLALGVVGGTAVAVFENLVIQVIGVAAFAIAGATLAIGFVRYRRTSRLIAELHAASDAHREN
jgi:putative membrane protein